MVKRPRPMLPPRTIPVISETVSETPDAVSSRSRGFVDAAVGVLDCELIEKGEEEGEAVEGVVEEKDVTAEEADVTLEEVDVIAEEVNPADAVGAAAKFAWVVRILVTNPVGILVLILNVEFILFGVSDGGGGGAAAVACGAKPTAPNRSS